MNAFDDSRIKNKWKKIPKLANQNVMALAMSMQKKNRITQNMRTCNDQNHIGHSVYRTNNSHIDEKMLFREFNKT